MAACPSFAQDAISFQRDIFLNATICMLEENTHTHTHTHTDTHTNGEEHKLGALDRKLSKKLVTF